MNNTPNLETLRTNVQGALAPPTVPKQKLSEHEIKLIKEVWANRVRILAELLEVLEASNDIEDARPLENGLHSKKASDVVARQLDQRSKALNARVDKLTDELIKMEIDVEKKNGSIVPNSEELEARIAAVEESLETMKKRTDRELSKKFKETQETSSQNASGSRKRRRSASPPRQSRSAQLEEMNTRLEVIEAQLDDVENSFDTEEFTNQVMEQLNELRKRGILRLPDMNLNQENSKLLDSFEGNLSKWKERMSDTEQRIDLWEQRDETAKEIFQRENEALDEIEKALESAAEKQKLTGARIQQVVGRVVVEPEEDIQKQARELITRVGTQLQVDWEAKLREEQLDIAVPMSELQERLTREEGELWKANASSLTDEMEEKLGNVKTLNRIVANSTVMKRTKET